MDNPTHAPSLMAPSKAAPVNARGVAPAPTPPVEDSYRLHRRFDRLGRLVGDTGMARLIASKVMIIGLGGVGSFVAESLVRSGIGHVILIDFDKVCVTNSNRQLQAMRGTIGKLKAEVLGERLRKINPQAQIEVVPAFYHFENADDLLGMNADWVVDAIDNITAKCHLLAECRRRGQKVVCSTGASGRLDPTALKIADLSETHVDPLAHSVRKYLRQKHGFPAKGPWGIPSVFSTESPLDPWDLTYDGGNGFRCVCPGGSNDFHSCETRNRIWGTAGFVTGTFGMACASVVVRDLVGSMENPSPHGT